jgi:indolepyruvate ferredoxin oxidoreductase beta subunit
MEINSTSVSGYLRFWLLAKLRFLRPYGYRYKQEQQQIDNWLWLIREAAKHSAELALEVAECARLIKGYGDTHARARQLPRDWMRVIRPAGGPDPRFACGRRSRDARTAAWSTLTAKV